MTANLLSIILTKSHAIFNVQCFRQTFLKHIKQGFERLMTNTSSLIGRQIGDYAITAMLGQGGMAVVYRARQISLDRDVAIKVIQGQFAHQKDFVARFEREAKVVANLQHPFILRVFDFGSADDLVYLVMALQGQGSLAQVLREQKKLTPSAALTYLEQIASALDYAHRKGIIHRDLKPQNVLIGADGSAILTDFGIARVLSDQTASMPTAGTALTQTGVMVGTPAYMAPEQWRGEALNAYTDLYALAVLTFELLSGELPFEGEQAANIMYKHLHEPPKALSQLCPELPRSLEIVLNKGMAKDPTRRFRSAGEFVDAFRLAISGKVPPDLEVTIDSKAPPSPPSSLQVWWVGAAVLLVLGSLIAFILSRANDSGVGAGQAVGVVETQARQTADVRLTQTAELYRETLVQQNLAEAAATQAAFALLQNPTATLTPTQTSTSTATLDLQMFAQQTVAAQFTETANAQQLQTLVQQAVLSAAATATALAPTATATQTPTATSTATATFTLTASPTFTATFTPTPLVVVTATPTLQPSVTPSHTPFQTATPVPDLILNGTPVRLPNQAPVRANVNRTRSFAVNAPRTVGNLRFLANAATADESTATLPYAVRGGAAQYRVTLEILSSQPAAVAHYNALLATISAYQRIPVGKTGILSAPRNEILAMVVKGNLLITIFRPKAYTTIPSDPISAEAVIELLNQLYKLLPER